MSLPYEPSDSEDEFITTDQELDLESLQSRPNDLPSPSTTSKPHKVTYFPTPTIKRLNPDVSIPRSPVLILGTDLVTSSVLEYSGTIASAVPVIQIDTLIQKDSHNTIKNKKNKDENAKPHYITYILSLIPSTNTLLGTSNVDIPAKYANFIAKALFPTKGCGDNVIEYFDSINELYSFYAVPITTLSPQDQLFYTSNEKYPYVYTFGNTSRIVSHTGNEMCDVDDSNDDNTNNPETSAATTTKTTQSIPSLPSTIGLTGFQAAILTYSTLNNVKCISCNSIFHHSYLIELFTSFQKFMTYDDFFTKYGVVSIYGRDVSEKKQKLTIGVRNIAVKAIMKIYESKIAYNNHILPHKKQGGTVPTSMFF